MKTWEYFVVLFLGVACFALGIVTVVMSATNQQMQARLQAQQQQLNQGILGQQAQQISAGIVQDLTAAAGGGNLAIRDLLQKHGHPVPPLPPAVSNTPPGTAPADKPGKKKGWFSLFRGKASEPDKEQE